MTAPSQAQAASEEVEGIGNAGAQMRTMLAQINAVRAQADEMGNKAKALLAGAAQIAAGGTGTGQLLQTRVGQTQIKLSELAKVLQHAANMCEGISTHAAGVQSDIDHWITTLSS